MMQHRSSHSCVIFADDLTGANDTGVQFARVGLRTRVSFDASQTAALDASDILVIDTDSRACNAAAAYQRVYAAAHFFAQRSIPVLYKKLDSTLRGALGAELDAVMDAYATQLVVLSPAFPAQQRTLLQGTLHLAGAPATPSRFAADPQRAVREIHLPALLAGQTRRAVHALGLDAISAGASQLAARLQNLRVAEGAIVVCDAATDAHLATIVEATITLGEGCLLAGSAGLARPLAARIAPQIDEAHKGGRTRTSAIRGGARSVELPDEANEGGRTRTSASRDDVRVLVVIGSRHPIIRAQLDALVRQHAAHVIALDPAATPDAAAWEAWLAHALQRIDPVAPAAPIVLTTPSPSVSTNRGAALLPRLAKL
ncbi:four-carbon acid sugar kinase family protein, partial [Caldilinea sp.]|uniref:four-carbon acid sugar kinase family protein n=1 Tax=Caldilinea sp. TaxID=2293560 RepID=UPI002C185ADB|nr:four-carbon acid sugar kinase family protein [Caldilinea sp.]